MLGFLGCFPCFFFVRVLASSCRATVTEDGCEIIALLLPLHPAVLKPNLNLAFRQAQRIGNFDSSASRQITIVMEFLL